MSEDGDELGLHQTVELDHISFEKSDTVKKMTPASGHPWSHSLHTRLHVFRQGLSSLPASIMASVSSGESLDAALTVGCTGFATMESITWRCSLSLVPAECGTLAFQNRQCTMRYLQVIL